MAKKGGFSAFLGESLGLTGPDSAAPATKKPEEKGQSILGEILTDVIGVEVRGGLKQGVEDFMDDVFHKSPVPEPRKKVAVSPPEPVAQVPAGKPQQERLLTGGNGGENADVPVSRTKKFINTAVFVVSGGVKIGADVVHGTSRVVQATRETMKRKTAERQAKAREGSTIIDGEVKE